MERENGVLILKSAESMHKRSYRSIRIPPAVYKRYSQVVRQMTGEFDAALHLEDSDGRDVHASIFG